MKFIYKIISIFILCFLFSCNTNDDREEYIIGFSQAMTTDNWRKEMNKSMEIEASMSPEIFLDIKDAQNDVQKQISQIEEFIDEGVDVIIVSPIQSVPITSVIEKAMNAGIPTIIIDRKVSGNNFTAYIGANNEEIGRNAGRYIISTHPGNASVVEIKGLEGSSPAYERSAGFREVLQSVERLHITGVVNGDWEKQTVKEQFKQLLNSLEVPDFVFSHNDRMALGVWEVLKEEGLDDQVEIIGVDGLFGPNEGIQLVKDGVLSATVLYPTGGSEAIKLARQLIKKESVRKYNILRTVVIDSVNVDIMQNQFDKMNQQQNDIRNQQVAIDRQIITYNSQTNLVRLMIFLLLLLLILASWSIYLVVKLKRRKKGLENKNQEILAQRNQIEDFAGKLKSSNEARTIFFTALSHEFKTPLTLITSSIESISNSRNLKEFGYETKLIKNNSERLLRLINELLDFRRLESGSFQLKPAKTNLFEFLETIYEDFRAEAVKKSIDFELETIDKNVEVYIDRAMMDKVFFNLLSNAFKFTPKNGRILVSIQENSSESVEVIVKDSGIGIPKGEYEEIFDPFVQASNNNRPSSGLGLFITKQFVELHKGTISIFSKQGAEFKITLLKGQSHFINIQISEDLNDLNSNADHGMHDENTEEEILFNELEDAETILIIEDNLDLSSLLRRKLIKEFNVHLSDGTDGLEKALELIPDVIVCDINLPDKTGFEICEILKADLRTSHIPTLILTALSDEESRLKALRAGADAYITKPFNFEVFKQSLLALLYNREKLRYYYTNRIDQVNDVHFNNSDQNFLKHLNSTIENNFKDPAFTVEELAEKLLISRVQLYRKVKAILGVSISEYINSLRLNKAKTLLQDSNLNISEVAYSVGYSSPGYFSTSFKNKFGVSPKVLKK